jgi:hypothetical protein
MRSDFARATLVRPRQTRARKWHNLLNRSILTCNSRYFELGHSRPNRRMEEEFEQQEAEETNRGSGLVFGAHLIRYPPFRSLHEN